MPSYSKEQQLHPFKKLKTKHEKPKKRSMLMLFQQIWAERPHQCEICGADLPYLEPPLACFPHRLNKKTWSAYKYCRPNIAITCVDHHEKIDAQRHEKQYTIVQECEKWLQFHPEDRFVKPRR